MAEENTEPDNNDVPDGDTQKQAGKDETRRICISYNEQMVQIEGPDSMEEMAKLAAYFWLLTSPPNPARLGFSAGSVLITERSAPDAGTDERATR